jgi:hypothetical protein
MEFVIDHFFDEHIFLNYYGKSQHLDTNKTLNLSIKNSRNYIKILRYLYKSKKIVIHGLFDPKLVAILFVQPWLLKKCYWVMWGGDLYYYQLRKKTFKSELYEFVRKQVIKKMGHFITYIKGDHELAQKWYGAKGKYNECFMYPSNLYKEYEVKQKEHKTINIQVGNSADPTNNHIDVLQKLTKYKDEGIKIYAPLSYGDQEYAKDVIAKGKEIFGNKFIALTDFMPFDKYLEFLGDIDIAIFAHKRQQAMGNSITLLGLGKKVYMRSDITPWQLFKEMDVKVFDVENIEINSLRDDEKKYNQNRIKEYFSEENYLQQLKNLFRNE